MVAVCVVDYSLGDLCDAAGKSILKVLTFVITIESRVSCNSRMLAWPWQRNSDTPKGIDFSLDEAMRGKRPFQTARRVPNRLTNHAMFYGTQTHAAGTGQDKTSL